MLHHKLVDLQAKLAILADAAKYDASCASSGTSKRTSKAGKGIGSTEGMGICHAYAPDGRCISLLKILLTNSCIFDCHYCINRKSSNVRRARFTAEEVVRLTLEFYKRNYIEGLFLSSGIIRSSNYTMEQIVEVARSLREDHDYQAQLAGTWRVPLAVLVDHDSASASEIFAGAIRDHRRGLIIGQRSYGKGSVQGIFPLAAAGAGVRLTTAKFYSPSGQPISHRGVEPDVVVRVAARVDASGLPARGDATQDEELMAAIRVFREQFTSR